MYVKPQRFHEVAVEYPLRPAAIRGRGRQDAGASKVSSVLVGTATFLFHTALHSLTTWSSHSCDNRWEGRVSLIVRTLAAVADRLCRRCGDLPEIFALRSPRQVASRHPSRLCWMGQTIRSTLMVRC